MQALGREQRIFWRSWRVLAARRAIDTFEQVSRLGRIASRRTGRTPLTERVRGLLETLQGHLMVFLVEDELVAGHLGRVVRTKLQKIHAATHPAARLERRELADGGEPRKGVDEDERAELLSSLAAEAAEEDELDEGP